MGCGSKGNSSLAGGKCGSGGSDGDDSCGNCAGGWAHGLRLEVSNYSGGPIANLFILIITQYSPICPFF